MKKELAYQVDVALWGEDWERLLVVYWGHILHSMGVNALISLWGNAEGPVFLAIVFAPIGLVLSAIIGGAFVYRFLKAI
jgi:hypothetical protein